MNILLILAYLAIIGFAAAVIYKVIGYLKHPMHLRWELYPVAHEVNGRAAYGGSYLEDAAWWQHKTEHSVVGATMGFLMEAVTLHATFIHNRPLWVRTYPFHLGLYACWCTMAGCLLCALLTVCGVPADNAVQKLLWVLVYIANVVSFIGVFFGGVGLIQRRLCDKGLRMYSSPKHYFNLAAFALWALLGGICLCEMMGTGVADGMSFKFYLGLVTFNGGLLSGASCIYVLYCILSVFLMVYVPCSFLAHMFMKYFTWHDIRWGDEPTQDSKKIQEKLMENLNRPVSWSAPHVQGDGKKTWAEIATTMPKGK